MMTKTIYIMIIAACLLPAAALVWDIPSDPDKIEVALYCQDYVKPGEDMVFEVKVHSVLSEPFEGKIAVFAWHFPSHLLEVCLDDSFCLSRGETIYKQRFKQNSMFQTGMWCAVAKIYSEYPFFLLAQSETCCVEIE